MTGFPQPLAPVGHIEPVPRRIRAVLAGAVVLHTSSARYVCRLPDPVDGRRLERPTTHFS